LTNSSESNRENGFDEAPAPAQDAAASTQSRSKDWRKPKNRRGHGRRGGRRRRRAGAPRADEGQALAEQPAGEGEESRAETQDQEGEPREAAEVLDEGAEDEGAGPLEDADEDVFGAGILDESPAAPRTRASSPARRGASAPASDAGATWGEQRAARDRAPREAARRTEAPAEGARGGSPATGGNQGGKWGERPLARGAGAAPALQRGDRRERGVPQAQGVEPARAPAALQAALGVLVLEKGGYGILRQAANQYLPGKDDVFVPPFLVQRLKLVDGSLVAGRVRRHTGQHKWALEFVDTVDGADPRERMGLVPFKKLTSIDPDFHYSVGDITGDVSMRVIDLICPVGRGTRGLIVAPPRSGKTILMRKFAAGIAQGYPETELIVLLVDERPEEATEWQRTTKGQVFVSTNDESPENHVQLAEVVWKRCQRLVELGRDVVLLLDSITRLARAYNNLVGGSGRTLSGGLDSRAMERPRAFFGSARNTETAGSLTILGTTLVDTGSRLDQLVFEEFKGTGNMELVLSRKLADRRIFPAIDIERSGTRKEEKLISAKRLKQINTLRRVLLKMNFIEAMELLITKLEDVEKTDDFLKRFEVDPEA
jgi:transcription termination factor Rho